MEVESVRRGRVFGKIRIICGERACQQLCPCCRDAVPQPRFLARSPALQKRSEAHEMTCRIGRDSSQL